MKRCCSARIAAGGQGCTDKDGDNTTCRSTPAASATPSQISSGTTSDICSSTTTSVGGCTHPPHCEPSALLVSCRRVLQAVLCTTVLHACMHAPLAEFIDSQILPTAHHCKNTCAGLEAMCQTQRICWQQSVSRRAIWTAISGIAVNKAQLLIALETWALGILHTLTLLAIQEHFAWPCALRWPVPRATSGLGA
jgi:hypothetical protein